MTGQTRTGKGVSGRVLSRDGTTIAYLSRGAGPAVIVVPGVLSLAADYGAFARELAAVVADSFSLGRPA